MSERKPISYLIALAGILVCIGLGVAAYRDEQNLYTIASLVGSVASLFALIIAMIQITNIKRISEATNKAVEETKDKIIHAISVSDVSKALKLIDEVQLYASHKEHRLTQLRLKDIRSLLVQFIASGELDRIEKCESVLVEIGTHISNLFDVIIGRKKTFNPSSLNGALERLTTILIKFETHLKYLAKP